MNQIKESALSDLPRTGPGTGPTPERPAGVAPAMPATTDQGARTQGARTQGAANRAATDPSTTDPSTTDPSTTKPVATKPAEPSGTLTPPTGTRASYTWLALTAAAIGLVLLIIFILQNTQTVTVSFLWLQGSLPLAVALLIAGVATLILTLAVGAARILQLRRFSRKAAKRGNKLAAPN